MSPMAQAAEEQAGPWLCVPIEEVECESTGECQSNMFESLNLPQFIKVDLAAKRVSGMEDKQEEVAAIQHIEQLDGRFILQGAQNGRGWSLVIVEETGRMTLSVSGEEVAFLAFGACTRMANWLETGKTTQQQDNKGEEEQL